MRDSITDMIYEMPNFCETEITYAKLLTEKDLYYLHFFCNTSLRDQ